MSYISGWFESEEGAVLFEYEGITDFEALAFRLYLDFGDDCCGVDMEVEGEYTDGTDVETTMTELRGNLEFLCS